ncbi:hypothetical protein PQX77_010897 [Marasmius sp. AFHP31]|nr:hypothetical protein PQX77_010897 [Marasmius sp. AFHP31]
MGLGHQFLTSALFTINIFSPYPLLLMKRKRNNASALSSRVDFIVTQEDDDPQIQQMPGGTYEERWNEARAQLHRVFDMLTHQRPRLFRNSDQGGLFSDVPLHDTAAPDDDEWEDYHFQPAIGDEGLINSNAGGEYDYHTFLNSLLADAPERIDMRERHYRTEDRTQSWNRQLPRLADAYLRFQSTGHLDMRELEDERWRILVVSFDEYDKEPDIRSLFPSSSLEDQLRVSYDAYLAILREVQARVDRELGRDPHQHFVHNVCPPCMYQLKNEIPLDPSILLAMDGNNSLKMVDIDRRPGRARLDTRTLHHPRWLDAPTVDVFKDEVTDSHKRGQPVVTPAPDTSDEVCDGPEFVPQGVAWLNVNEVEGLEKCMDTCVERWKAAAPDGNKKMYSFFSISGIFVSVCRHGHVLVVCDMRRSGELMKYPLAVVKELLDRYGKDIGLGYDIIGLLPVDSRESCLRSTDTHIAGNAKLVGDKTPIDGDVSA